MPSLPGTEMVHHSADANGTRLHYVRAGSGEPLVLIHGFPETWFAWRRVIPALAERFTVIAPDLRGMGDSAPAVAGWDKATLAEDIHSLMQSLGYDRVRLVGHDFGVPVSWFYAAQHRDEVLALAALEGLVPGYEPGDPRELGNKGWFVSFNSVPDLSEALVSGREQIYLRYLFQDWSYDPTVISPEDLDEYTRTFARPGNLRAGFSLYRTREQDVIQAAALAQTPLAIPVLALGGEASMGAAVEAGMRALATDVEGCVLDQAGHYLAEEQPRQVTELLLDFFERSRT